MAQALAEAGVSSIALLDVKQDLGDKAAAELHKTTGIPVQFYNSRGVNLQGPTTWTNIMTIPNSSITRTLSRRGHTPDPQKSPPAILCQKVPDNALHPLLHHPLNHTTPIETPPRLLSLQTIDSTNPSPPFLPPSSPFKLHPPPSPLPP